MKGAPQAVAALLHPPVEIDGLLDELASNGIRVLAVAAGTEGELELAGLLGFMDPPRSDSKELVKSLHELGVRVIMVTGDTASTARAVADELGIGSRVGTREALSRPLDCDVLAGV